MNGDLLAAALAYAGDGRPVFPCRPRGKRPMVEGGFKAATTAREQVKAWWTTFRMANIGIPTGAGSGFVALDIDPGGDDSLAELTRQHGPLPETCEVKTGRGRQLWFASPGVPIGCKTGFRRGLDFRGDGGYVIVPPSLHANGRQYAFLNDCVFAEMPDWLNKVICQGKSATNPAFPANGDSGEKVREGARNATLASIAGTMRNRGLGETAIRAALVDHNLRQCEPPLPEAEVAGIAASYAKYPAGAASPSPKNKTARLLELVEHQSPMLFHTETGEPFARVKVETHSENLPINSVEFSAWLKHLAWRATKEAVNAKTMDEVRGVLESKARFDGSEHRLYNRVAWHRGTIWYDLADPHWNAVKVTPDDWQLEIDVPVLFRRYAHQRPQVVPDRTGRLSEAEDFLNLGTQMDADGHAAHDERYLFLVALTSYLLPDIPHPVIVLHGEHGAAKTTLSRMSRELIDPSATLTLGEPKRDEIGQLLQHHYLLPFDNLSFLPGWLSDTLCRAITGDGLSKRRLYTDEDDVIFAFRRCILLNGINAVTSRADLLDRSLLLECQPIPDSRRMPERVFWERFEIARARILGAMFNTLSRAMRCKDSLRLPSLPRMADFAEWGCAIAEASGWGQRAFLEAYTREAAGRNLIAIDSNPVAQALIAFTENRQDWSGTAADLISELCLFATGNGIDTRASGWPKQPHVLSRRINEAIPNFRRLGLRVTHGWRGSNRIITLTRRGGNENSEGSEGSEGFDGNEST